MVPLMVMVVLIGVPNMFLFILGTRFCERYVGTYWSGVVVDLVT